jgi:arabinogalactan endo-1,4-beta-galactosidase
LAKVPDGKGLGVFVWEPAWIPTPQMGSGWAAGNSAIVVANQAHFDYYGRALPSSNIWPRLFPAYNGGDGGAATPEPAAEITSLAAAAVTTAAGAAPSLPAAVTATFSDGTSKEVSVAWDEIDASLYAAAGSFAVSGAVEGTALRASCAVTVTAVGGGGSDEGGNLLLAGNPRNAYFDGAGVGNYSGTDWTVPAFWGSPATSATETRATPSGVAGSRMALKYWSNASPGADANDYRAYVAVAPAAGASFLLPGEYRLSCYARSGSTGTNQYFSLYAAAGGETAAFAIPNTNTWTERQLTVVVPEGAARIEVGIRFESGLGSGAWGQFDDFSLTYVG